MNIMLGSDPEVMLASNSGLVSAIPFFKGTKDNPEKVDGGIVSHDNVNVEYGSDPASSKDEWLENHRKVIRKLVEMLPSKNHSLVVMASADFPEAELASKEAREFGCSPDFEAYGPSINQPPDVNNAPNLRSCGGHIHVGSPWLVSDIQRVLDLVKAMDVFLGIPSLLIDKDPTSARRRELYGKAGCHRPKPYGLEYRTLSNFWVGRPRLAGLMYDLTMAAINACQNKNLHGINENMIRDTINAGDTKTAMDIVTGIVRGLTPQEVYKEIMACRKLVHKSDIKEWL